MDGISDTTDGGGHSGPLEKARSAAKTPGRATIASAGAFFCLVVVQLFAVSMLVGDRGVGGLIGLHLFAVLLPSIAYVGWSRLSWRDDLRWKRVRPRALLGAALLGSGAWLVIVSTVLQVQSRYFPPPEEFLAQREALFLSATRPAEWLWVWVGAALVPAFSEEILFRGVLFASLRTRVGDRAGVLIVAVLFALFHMNHYQLVSTFLLGSILGWLVVRTGSLWAAVVFHLVNNSAILAAATVEGDTLPVPLFVGLTGLMAVGVALLAWEGAGRGPFRFGAASGACRDRGTGN